MEEGEEEMSESEEEVAGGGRPAMGRKSKFIQDEAESNDYDADEEGEEEMEEGEEEISEDDEEAPELMPIKVKKPTKKIIKTDEHEFSSSSSCTSSEEPSYMRDSVHTSELESGSVSAGDAAYDQGFVFAHNLDTYRRTKSEKIAQQTADKETDAHQKKY